MSFTYSVCFILIFLMSSQVPGLPRGVAGTVRRTKKNKSGINGRIMDPLARRAAQRAAIAAQTGNSEFDDSAQPAVEPPIRTDPQPSSAVIDITRSSTPV